MYLYLLISLSLLSTIGAFSLQRYPHFVCRLSTTILSCLFVMSLAMPFLITHNFHTTWTFMTFSHITLSLELLFDRLTWVMLCLITFISMLIHRYSSRYLLSDAPQARFIGQLSALTTAVIFLVTSGNLFTLFIAWHFVGLCLYLLLNHYHYDIKANKAAKKKFIINRIGDVSFLAATLLTYKHYGTTSFPTLFAVHHSLILSPNRLALSPDTTILILLFIAVITKSAQFPFHIWLPDTMETPTPVSALMHAGVINAGGFLMARLSPWFVQSPALMHIIFLIGLITAFLGGFFMLTQTDIKKQLAYSTMGQMGYMVLQCGLGCFSAAVFHLIAHGFFKGSLFLQAGGVLQTKRSIQTSRPQKRQHYYWNGCLAMLITIMTFATGWDLLIFLHHASAINPILWTFLIITLWQFNWKTLNAGDRLTQTLMPCIAFSITFLLYLLIIKRFDGLLQNIIPENGVAIPPWEMILTIGFVSISLIIWIFIQTPFQQSQQLKKKLYILSLTKGNIERYYRDKLVFPLRQVGEWGYQLCLGYHSSKKLCWTISSGLTAILLIFTLQGIYTWYTTDNVPPIHQTSLLWMHFIIFSAALTIANRTRTLSELWLLLLIACLSLTNLGLFVGNNQTATTGIYYFININALFFGVFLLMLQYKKQSLPLPIKINRLPWLSIYMSIFLMLLIGLPGSSGFIGEFFLLNTLLKAHLLLSIGFACSTVLLALVILHTLQMYVFNPARFSRLDPTLPKTLHCVCCIIIAFNVWNGIYPMPLIKGLTSIARIGLS